VRGYKGLGDLITAFPHVRSRIPAVLVVAGNFFESVEKFRRQISALKLDGDVKLFPNYVPDNEVAALFRVSALVVLPYRTGSQTGIAPLAAALGKPIVSTAAGGISEAVPGERVARPGDPIGLADQIVSSLRNPDTAVRPTSTWEEWAETILSSAAVD
jgi:glycosyltransferase involved in cell wall biosynthesis